MADAMLYTIEGRSRAHDAETANLGQFSLGEGQEVSSQIILDEPNWTPYCLNHEKQYMVFVDLPSDVALNDAVFVYATQFEYARRVMVVPYSSLEHLAAQIVLPENNTFIFSLPRSGTTLVSRMFNEVDDVWSLSEPDIFTDLSFLSASDANPEDITQLLKLSVHLMFRPQANVTNFVLKFRSQALFIAEQFYRAFPDANYLFLYRDGLSFGDSFYRFVQKLGAPNVMDRAMVTDMWQALAVEADTYSLEYFLDHDLDAVTWDEFFAAMYIRQCEQYLMTLESGVPYCAIRYNELDEDREAEVTRILEHCYLPYDALPQMMRAFDYDSQAGTAIARDIDAEGFTVEQVHRFLAVMADYPTFNDPNRILSDVYYHSIA